MSPEVLEIVKDVVSSMRSIAKSKKELTQDRISAADTVANLLHVVSDLQHNTADRIAAEHFMDDDGGEVYHH